MAYFLLSSLGVCETMTKDCRLEDIALLNQSDQYQNIPEIIHNPPHNKQFPIFQKRCNFPNCFQ